MRITATCDHCRREFLLFQLYCAAPTVADRCPHCSAHLGIVRVGPLAASTDGALAALVTSLKEIAGRHPGFRLDRDSVLRPIEEVLEPVAGDASTPARAA